MSWALIGSPTLSHYWNPAHGAFDVEDRFISTVLPRWRKGRGQSEADREWKRGTWEGVYGLREEINEGETICQGGWSVGGG